MGRHIWRLLPFVRPYRKRVATGLLSNAMARAFDLLPILVVGKAVDQLSASVSGKSTTHPSIFFWYSLIILATFLGLALFQSISDYSWDTLAQKVRHDLRVTLYDHLQKLDYSFFDERQTGDLMSVLSNDVDNLENFVADAITSMVRITITFAGTLTVLLFLDWRLALLLFMPLPFAFFAIRFFVTRVAPQYRRARKAVGDMNAILENNIQGMGVIQAYTAQKDQSGRIQEQSAEYRDAAVAAAGERARFIPLIYAIAGTSYAALIGGGAWLTFTGYGPSVGDYTSFVLYAMRLIMPLFVFGMLINQLQRSEASAQRITDLLKTEPAIIDTPTAYHILEPPSSIVFDNVHFGYPGRKHVINGVDLKLERGKVIGVVGPTGAGKSTLVKLLLRYYDPSNGTIKVDGHPLSDIAVDSWRRYTGYVSQEAFLFTGTVAENILLGRPEATLEEIRDAARIAGAIDFIENLPDGYETTVGERGMKLSGGQRQRISLARAVLRNPSILILDEATSAVDTRTEEAIQENLHKFRKGRATLAVAHRLSTVLQSDEIIVLVDGLVVERGNHSSLLRDGGVYADLWAVQSGHVEETNHNRADIRDILAGDSG
ncbi:MAG: ABC transporter ATP-binding protein [Pseudomonadota bacterium]